MHNVQIVRSSRRSSIGIQILPDTSVRISVPSYISDKQIQHILKEKDMWIKQQQLILQTRAQIKPSNEYLYLGKNYQIEQRLNQKNIVELSDKLYVASHNEKYIKTYLTSWYKQQARKVIGERVQLYATHAGLVYKSINIMEATTRWGSCSSQKNLNFNWKLIMAPLEVLDYVVTHELAHLAHLNHSTDFWEAVRKMFPLYRQYRTWLKRYGHMLTI